MDGQSERKKHLRKGRNLAFQVFVVRLTFNLPLAGICLHLIIVLAARAGFAAVLSWQATGK